MIIYTPKSWLRLSQAEQGQPVVVRLSGQQFGGAFTDAFGMLTAQEAPMVEEELEQREIIGPDMASRPRALIKEFDHLPAFHRPPGEDLP